MNCNILYPMAKSVWDCFPQYVIRPIDISINLSALCSPVQSSLKPSPTKAGFSFFTSINRNKVIIQKAYFCKVLLKELP